MHSFDIFFCYYGFNLAKKARNTMAENFLDRFILSDKSDYVF